MNKDYPDHGKMLELAGALLREEPPRMDDAIVEKFVSGYIENRDRFLGLVEASGSPLYLVDTDGIRRSLKRFREAFSVLPGPVEVFYALKSNNSPLVARTVIEEGAGIDVSSAAELQTALGVGAEKILFSGPGKTDHELSRALTENERVTLLINSFSELERLDAVTRKRFHKIGAGVRLTTSRDPLWRKFGIPLPMLEEFFRKAGPMPFIEIEGLQFHTSWNRDPGAQVAFIHDLASTLEELPGSMLRKIRFIDIGGGYWPEQGEWLRPGGTEAGRLRSLLTGGLPDPRERYLLESAPIERFAEEISRAIRDRMPQEIECSFYMEPGRWLCHDNMHLVMKVVDVKSPDFVITDAGTNAIGWERFEHDYFPVINLSSPSTVEQDCMIFGSLCTPHDVWGYSYHGRSIREGDVLLIPTQGAYTFSLKQEFIKPLPAAVDMCRSRKCRADKL